MSNLNYLFQLFAQPHSLCAINTVKGKKKGYTVFDIFIFFKVYSETGTKGLCVISKTHFAQNPVKKNLLHLGQYRSIQCSLPPRWPGPTIKRYIFRAHGL